ncbi:YcnI family protein [Brevibacillus fulvus]|uniref:Uncharacterized protein YcnI n=1 Tax=Brevibacillus fulvus TaxID=1125967 RepID=A0A938Y1B8_9BACL|nr:YcnI family protein [Brevibacillus fulvus]MBM7592104.1 uncharacterized protein YcnI [Brevibacillus fulvus]
MKRFHKLSVLAVLALVLSLAGTASAHVTVWPKESTANAYEKYTVRVPVEKEVNTTKVRVEFPTGVTVSTVQPIPNWSYTFEKDSEGRFTAITWTAENEGIKAHEFAEFSFQAKNPKEAGSLSWKAYQTYADGSVVEWTGAPETDTPAAVTTVNEAAAGADNHDASHDAAPTEQSGGTGTGNTSNTVALVLGGLALLLSLINLFRKKA